jgi:hypothetical protein
MGYSSYLCLESLASYMQASTLLDGAGAVEKYYGQREA